MAEHYFSPTPGSEYREYDVSLTLGGVPHRLSAPSGIFSPEGLDRGTRVLLDTVGSPQGTSLVDLGCGWGPIALTMAHKNPEATVWAVDVNQRALDATHKNAKSLGLENVKTITPDQFPPDLAVDTLWSNPPIRIGKQALHELINTWLTRLSPDGEAWLVVAKQLGADSLQHWINDSSAGPFRAERVETAKGFRVFRVRRA